MKILDTKTIETSEKSNDGKWKHDTTTIIRTLFGFKIKTLSSKHVIYRNGTLYTSYES